MEDKGGRRQSCGVLRAALNLRLIVQCANLWSMVCCGYFTFTNTPCNSIRVCLWFIIEGCFGSLCDSISCLFCTIFLASTVASSSVIVTDAFTFSKFFCMSRLCLAMAWVVSLAFSTLSFSRSCRTFSISSPTSCTGHHQRAHFLRNMRHVHRAGACKRFGSERGHA